MKKVILILLIFVSHFSFSQSWLWGREGKTSHNGGGDLMGDHTVTVDVSGNVIITGIFWDSLSFGSHNLYNSTDEAFVAKYDAGGNPLWAVQGGGANSFGYGVGTDNVGNVYVEGSFVNTGSFGIYILSSATNNIFLVKYDPNGNVQWAKQAVLPSKACNVFSTSMAVDARGNSYVTGYFKDTVSFGALMLKSLSNNPNGDAFLVKYDLNGNVLWAKQGIVSSFYSVAQGNSVTVDRAGNAYITGYFLDTVSFGSSIVKSAIYARNFFLVKYDVNGNVLWVQQSAVPSMNCQVNVNSLVTDGLGNTYSAGTFSDTVLFGSFTLGYSSTSVDKVFLVKYSPTGSLLWAKEGYSMNKDTWKPTSVASDTLQSGGGYWVLTGQNKSPYKFVYGIDTFKLSTNYQSATIFMQFDSLGNVKCGKIFSEGDEDDGNGVGVDHSGQYVFLAGDIQDTTVFGKDTLTLGSDMVFIARWQPCANPEGISEIHSTKANTVVYPNPSNGKFNIQLSVVSGKSSVEIYNMLGERIYNSEFRIQNSTFKIDISSQPAGIYLYRVITQKGEPVGEGKLIKE